MLFGQIDYINCLPVTLPLLEDKPVGLDFRFDNPGNLNRAFARGELDVGAMSAHYFLESGAFDLLPSICISSRGAVGSVFLFSRLPLKQLHGAHLALPEASATSVNLLKILLFDQGIEPRFSVQSDPSPFDIASQNYFEADAWLMLGDRALLAQSIFQSQSSSQLSCIDLGQWWFDESGLPMVFGVWAARRSYALENPGDCRAIDQILLEALSSGLEERFAAVIDKAHGRLPELSIERLRRYFRSELSYLFTDEHRLGLERFADKCRQYGLV